MAPLHPRGSGLRRPRRRQHPAAQHPDLRHRTAQGPVTVRPIHLSRRSTRPGCELPPAAPELPVRPNRTEGGAPTIEPATPSGRSTRPGCECPPAAPKLPARPNRTEGGAPTECARQTDIRCRSTRPGCEGAVRGNSELAIYRKAGQLFEGVTVDGG